MSARKKSKAAGWLALGWWAVRETAAAVSRLGAEAISYLVRARPEDPHWDTAHEIAAEELAQRCRLEGAAAQGLINLARELNLTCKQAKRLLLSYGLTAVLDSLTSPVEVHEEREGRATVAGRPLDVIPKQLPPNLRTYLIATKAKAAARQIAKMWAPRDGDICPRQHRLRVREHEQYLRGLRLDDYTADLATDGDLIRDILPALLDELSPGESALVTEMLESPDSSAREAARGAGLPENSAGTRLARVRKKLRALAEDDARVQRTLVDVGFAAHLTA